MTTKSYCFRSGYRTRVLAVYIATVINLDNCDDPIYIDDLVEYAVVALTNSI